MYVMHAVCNFCNLIRQKISSYPAICFENIQVTIQKLLTRQYILTGWTEGMGGGEREQKGEERERDGRGRGEVG